MMSVDVGDKAPNFALPATGGRDVSLAEHAGRTVVLVFYPGDETYVCTKQLCSYNDELSQFKDLDAVVLAVSPQGIASHEKFAERHRFGFPLLADVDKSVASAYGVVGLLGLIRRSVFVIDGGGVIRYAHRALAGVTFRPVAELVAAVRAAS